MNPFRIALLLVLCLGKSAPVAAGDPVPERAILDAVEFGLAGDGTTDDGPAIQKMVARARERTGPVELRFPQGKVVRVEQGTGRYAFLLEGEDDLRIHGHGSEFRLAPQLRFLQAVRCANLTVEDLKVDYLEQPTTPGTILAVDPAAQAIEVKLDQPELAGRLGGPTYEDGEQAFFGMMLLDAIHHTTAVHHFYADSVSNPAPGIVRVSNSKSNWAQLQQHVRPGITRIDLPVPGVAHRFGPGPLISTDSCRDVTFSDVEIWSAPWMAFGLTRNEGLLTLRRVNVRPKPGSGKVLSSCRDAIHAKGNRAELLFEDCVLDGLGDDALNISTHCSRIRRVVSPVQIEISQQFPIGYIPMRAGDTLVVMSPATNALLAERSIVAIQEIPSLRPAREGPHLEPWAPSLNVTLNAPIDALEKGLVVWDRQSSNPKSTLRRCVIRRSCRLQTPVTIEDCDIAALLWFYGDTNEGPGPEAVVVRNSTLKSNSLDERGGTVMSFSGWSGSKRTTPLNPADTVLKSARVLNNRIWGNVTIAKSLHVEFSQNRIVSSSKDPLRLESCGTVSITANALNGQPTSLGASGAAAD